MLWNLSEGHQKTDEQNFKNVLFIFRKDCKLFIKSFLCVFLFLLFLQYNLKYFEPNKVWCEKYWKTGNKSECFVRGELKNLCNKTNGIFFKIFGFIIKCFQFCFYFYLCVFLRGVFRMLFCIKNPLSLSNKKQTFTQFIKKHQTLLMLPDFERDFKSFNKIHITACFLHLINDLILNYVFMTIMGLFGYYLSSSKYSLKFISKFFFLIAVLWIMDVEHQSDDLYMSQWWKSKTIYFQN